MAREHPEVPPRVAYELISLGSTLCGVVGDPVTGSASHRTEIDAARAEFDGADAQEAGGG